MKYPSHLCGRIERVYIQSMCEGSPSIGLVGGERITVNHAPTPEGESCLVRVNMRSVPGSVYGNFITSQIPDGFTGLGLEQYALVALWEERMVKQRRYPTFDEIGHYYLPGNLGQVYYFAAEDTKRRRVRIRSDGVIPSGKSYRAIVHDFLPHGGVNLLMAETLSLLEDICAAFRGRGLTPIRMEALR